MTDVVVPRLHLIGPLDGVISPERYPEVAERAVTGGVGAVHVRLPRESGGDVLGLTREIVAWLGSSNGVFVNDRIDVAMLVHAAGVHLGERSIPVQDARSLVAAGTLLGRSVHDIDGALRAQQDGADFVIAGHIFDTDSKPGQPGRGVEWLAQLTQAVSIPVITIGGITVERVTAVTSAGAWGIAVGREILEAEDPAIAAHKLRKELERK